MPATMTTSEKENARKLGVKEIYFLTDSEQARARVSCGTIIILPEGEYIEMETNPAESIYAALNSLD